MTDEQIPPAKKLRWPILVVLDEMGQEDSILVFQDRVAEHLHLPDGAGDVVDPETGQPLLTARLIQAFGDLNAAGAVDADSDGGRMWITDTGRRLTETDAEDLPETEGGITPPATSEDRASLGDWILAFLDGLP